MADHIEITPMQILMVMLVAVGCVLTGLLTRWWAGFALFMLYFVFAIFNVDKINRQ